MLCLGWVLHKTCFCSLVLRGRAEWCPIWMDGCHRPLSKRWSVSSTSSSFNDRNWDSKAPKLSFVSMVTENIKLVIFVNWWEMFRMLLGVRQRNTPWRWMGKHGMLLKLHAIMHKLCHLSVIVCTSADQQLQCAKRAEIANIRAYAVKTNYMKMLNHKYSYSQSTIIKK